MKTHDKCCYGYNDPVEAFKGHMDACKEYEAKEHGSTVKQDES